MKRWLFLTILVLLVPICFSLYEKPIYNNWMLSGKSYIIENETYRAVYLRETNTTVIYLPNGLSAVILPTNNTCVREWLYSVCQTQQKFEKAGMPVPPNVNEARINVSLYLNINTSDVGLNFSRELEKGDFVGDVIEIKTTISKVSDYPVENVSFEDYLSSAFDIFDITGCEKSGNSVVWKGNINQKKKVICSYKIKAKKTANFENRAILSYVVFERLRENNDDYIFNVVEKPVEFGVSYGNETLFPNSTFNFSISLKKLKEVSIEEIKVSFPGHFGVFNYSNDFKLVGNTLKADNLALAVGELKDFGYVASSVFEGTHNINLSLTYTYNNLFKTLEKSIPVAYAGDVFYLSMFKKEGSSLLRISNPSGSYFSDIEVTIGNLSLKLNRLEQRRFKELDFPIIEDGRHLVKVRYRTSFGQILHTEYSLGYGDTTREAEKEAELSEQKEEQDQKAEEPVKNNEKIDFAKFLPYAAGVFVVIVILNIVFFLKSRFSKSGLDKEIEKLKKEAENEAKEK